MKNTHRKAFILNDCKSPYISQAIFILRDDTSGSEMGILADAERIVASYMGQPPLAKPFAQKRKIPPVITGAIFFAAAVIFAAAKLLI